MAGHGCPMASRHTRCIDRVLMDCSAVFDCRFCMTLLAKVGAVYPFEGAPPQPCRLPKPPPRTTFTVGARAFSPRVSEIPPTFGVLSSTPTVRFRPPLYSVERRWPKAGGEAACSTIEPSQSGTAVPGCESVQHRPYRLQARTPKRSPLHDVERRWPKAGGEVLARPPTRMSSTEPSLKPHHNLCASVPLW